MTSGVEACLNKRFETPELARIFNLRIDGEGRAARRRKKAKEDRGESVAERFMIDSMAGTEDPYEVRRVMTMQTFGTPALCGRSCPVGHSSRLYAVHSCFI